MLVSLSLLPLSASPRLQAQAAGSPIFDCPGMLSTATRMKAGLPQQDAWLKKEEDRLRDARAGINEAKADLQKAAFDGAKKLVEAQFEYVREAQDAIEKTRGFSNLARQRWLERVDQIKKAGDALEKSIKSGSAGADLGTEIAKNRATLDSALNFFRESGISDDLAETAAKSALVAKLISPGSALLVQMFPVALDLLFAGAKGVMSVNELEAAKSNLDAMRAANNASKARVYELEQSISTDCLPKAPPPNDRIMVKNPEPAPGAAAPPTTVTPPPPGGGVGAGAVLGGLVLAGGVAAGALYYAKKQAEAGGGGGGGGSVNMTFVSASTVTCVFNSGGVLSSCSGSVTVNITGSIPTGSTLRLQFDRGPAGTKTFSSTGSNTFSITGGTGGTSCPSSLGGLSLFNTSQSSSNVIAYVGSASVPVACR